ncbi:MAG: transglutaminase-like cysteine peptidase [Oceanospirillaceae bacterium]|nr:transglutaminase-like cysteine peptidase [Oceanospirillaceae bacterium]
MYNSTHTRQWKGSGNFKHSLALLVIIITCALALPLVVKSEPGVNLSSAFIKQMGQKYGQRAQLRLKRWQKLIKDLRNESEQTKLKEVNDFFNRVRFIDDIKHWRKKDYWATPVEFLVTNGGDCEDFTIAKYYTLKALGVDIAKLSIAYVKALDYNQAHMVLTYYKTPRSEPVILDNLIPQIKRASQRKDLLHVYSFNGDNLWISKKGRRANLVGSSDRLGPWVKLQKRLKTQ